MALVVKDRVKQTTTTTGTGNIVLNGNVDGFQTFAAALTDGDTTYFGIFVPSTNDYEVGLGTWTEGSATLARTTVLESSNSGSAINITAQAEVFITQPAEKAVFQDANGDVDLGSNKILFGNVYSGTNDLPSASTYHGMFAHVHGTGKAYYAHGGNWIELVNEDTSGNVSMGGNLTVTGDLTVNGTTTTVSTTNTVVKDSLIELGNGTSGSPSNDAGIVIERGSSDNAFIGYDESADKFTVGTGSFTGATTGNLTISTGTLVANVEGNVTGNVTGNTSGTAATVTTAAQPNITSVGTLTTLTVDDITINGSTISDAGDLTIDSGGDIILDANGADWKFKDDGTHVLNIENSSGDIKITSITNDKDIIFRGVDNGSAITALTLDMSDAGAATFNSSVTATALTVDEITIDGDTITATDDFIIDAVSDIKLDANGGYINFFDDGTAILTFQNSSTDAVIWSRASDRDMIFKGNDGGSVITALTLDMSAAGAATFNADVGIGVSPSNPGWSRNLHVHGSGNGGGLKLTDNTSGSGNNDGLDIASYQGHAYFINRENATMRFHTNDAEKARLDADGHFYVGTTDSQPPTNNDASGICLRSDGKVAASRSNGISGDFNTGADGEVVWFRKAGTETGKIAISGNDFQIFGSVSNIAGINFGNSKMMPMKSGSLANDAVDLGSSSYKWKDAYLSRNIYLGSNIYHDGDTDTYVGFSTNTVNINAGGGEVLSAASNGLFSQFPLSEDYDALSGTSPTCNVQLGGAFSLTMSGNTTFTFSGAVSGYGVGFILQLTGNGGTVTWPGSVKWAGGTAPDAPANGETDILVFHTRDGGTNWYGVLSSDAAA